MGTSEGVNYLTERLSDETLVHIFRHIHTHDDFISLSQTCQRLNGLLKDKEFCSSVILPWWGTFGRGSLTTFLRDRVRATVITRLDFSDLYWIPSGIMKDLVIGMVNLETLLTAGTTLSWAHLSLLLKSLPIKKLSWSWDNNLEESCRRRSSLSPAKFSELTEMSNVFLKLTSLLVHIPMMSKTPTDVLFYSYSALEYLVSLCQNLQQLWFISWPKTAAERKCSSSSYSRRDSDSFGTVFSKLHTLVVSVKGPPRFLPMSFFGKLINTFGVVTPAQTLWLDHPLVGVQSLTTFREHPVRRFQRPQAPYHMPYCSSAQQLCSESAERLSYPVIAMTHASKECFNYPKLKHLLLCHGQPVLVNLNGFFKNSPDLESFYCSTFNLRMDWNKFAECHPKLKSVCVSETEEIGDHAVAFSKLKDLQKLSVSMDCLYEIRNPTVLSDYLTMQHLDSTDCNAPTEIEAEGDESHENGCDNKEHISSTPIVPALLFKKQRVSKLPKNLPGETVTGLHFLSTGCSKINELEIGYGSQYQTRAGRLLPDSLFYISRFKLLRKLSLSSLPIVNGRFLKEICSNCDIESLRLTHLGPSAKCCYIPDLCQALTFCEKLKDFRLEQNYIGTPLPLMTALKKCLNLQRLLLWSSPNDKPIEFGPVDELFTVCSKLVMFYATIEPTTKSDCFKIRKALELKYKRPSLSVVLRRTLEEEELIYYPSIHYRQMITNGTQVCQFNDFETFNS